MAPLASLLAKIGCRSASAVTDPSKSQRTGKDRQAAAQGGARSGSRERSAGRPQALHLITPEGDLDLAAKLWKSRSERSVPGSGEAVHLGYQQACSSAIAESLRPVAQGRLTLVTLLVVQLMRVAAWLEGECLSTTVFGLHCLAAASDVLAFGATGPLFLCRSLIGCTEGRRAGLMLTLVFALSCVAVGTLIVYCFVCPIKPFSPGRRTVLKIVEAYLDLWECTIIASAALHISLLTCCWRVYKELRRNGLYPAVPPGAEVHEISVFEVFCEIEDVNDIKRGKQVCGKMPLRRGQCAACCATVDGGDLGAATEDEGSEDAWVMAAEEAVTERRLLEEAQVCDTIEWRQI